MLLGIDISDKLNVDTLLRQYKKEILINTFVYSDFNYSSLIWHFTTWKEIKKERKIQERRLVITIKDILCC